MMGEETPLTIKDNTLVGKDEEGKEESIPFKVDGKKITLTNEDAVMVFEKK